MTLYTATVQLAGHEPYSVGIWPAPDEPDLWVASLAGAGYPVELRAVAVHLTPAEFLAYCATPE